MDITAVLLTQLTSFAQELGQLRADVMHLRDDYVSMVAKLTKLEDTCQKLEIIVSSATAELRGRFSVEDRTDLQVAITAPNSQVVGINQGNADFKRGP